jgi:hypothetical protein
VSIHAKEREAQGERGAECAESKSKQEKREKEEEEGGLSAQAARHALTSCFNLANSGSDASAGAWPAATAASSAAASSAAAAASAASLLLGPRCCQLLLVPVLLPVPVALRLLPFPRVAAAMLSK